MNLHYQKTVHRALRVTKENNKKPTIHKLPQAGAFLYNKNENKTQLKIRIERNYELLIKVTKIATKLFRLKV